jgi:hypothetical protein
MKIINCEKVHCDDNVSNMHATNWGGGILGNEGTAFDFGAFLPLCATSFTILSLYVLA